MKSKKCTFFTRIKKPRVFGSGTKTTTRFLIKIKKNSTIFDPDHIFFMRHVDQMKFGSNCLSLIHDSKT